jgi:hypothetical protein
LLHKHIYFAIDFFKMEDFGQDPTALVGAQLTLEIIGSLILIVMSYLIYKRIEIDHPVYAIIFCDLTGTLASSLINTMVLPFVNRSQYLRLVNVNNFSCIVFHCCCWCILSILRYLYIVKQPWLDKTFPQPVHLQNLSLFSVIILFTLNFSFGMSTLIYFGYPQVRIMDMAFEQKISVVMIGLLILVSLILTSCWCYFKILRHNGKFGHNSVDVINDADISHTPTGGLFFVEDVHREMTARENIEMRNFLQFQQQAEINRQKAEIQSAMLSLKTNLGLLIFLISIVLIAVFSSSNTLAIIFSVLKNVIPVVTCIINFVKIKILMLNFSYDYLR